MIATSNFSKTWCVGKLFFCVGCTKFCFDIFPLIYKKKERLLPQILSIEASLHFPRRQCWEHGTLDYSGPSGRPQWAFLQSLSLIQNKTTTTTKLSVPWVICRVFPLVTVHFLLHQLCFLVFFFNFSFGHEEVQSWVVLVATFTASMALPMACFPCVGFINVLLLGEIITVIFQLVLHSLQRCLEKSSQILGICSFMS